MRNCYLSAQGSSFKDAMESIHLWSVKNERTLCIAPLFSERLAARGIRCTHLNCLVPPSLWRAQPSYSRCSLRESWHEKAPSEGGAKWPSLPGGKRRNRRARTQCAPALRGSAIGTARARRNEPPKRAPRAHANGAARACLQRLDPE